MTLKIAFTVDDFAPKPGYGLFLNNDPTVYLQKLHEEFGAKFTMYSIPLFEGNPQYSWENNLEWVKKVKAMKHLEIAQHGLTHTAQKPEWGAQEFAGISDEEAMQRIVEGKAIFRRVDIDVTGYKMPGWYIKPIHYDMLSNEGFNYVADHFTGNKIIKTPEIIKVPYTFTINKIYHDNYDDYLILHSHVSPIGGNLNAWTKENYESVRAYLKHLHKKNKDIEYVFISELVEEQKNE